MCNYQIADNHNNLIGAGDGARVGASVDVGAEFAGAVVGSGIVLVAICIHRPSLLVSNQPQQQMTRTTRVCSAKPHKNRYTKMIKKGSIDESSQLNFFFFFNESRGHKNSLGKNFTTFGCRFNNTQHNSKRHLPHVVLLVSTTLSSLPLSSSLWYEDQN